MDRIRESSDSDNESDGADDINLYQGFGGRSITVAPSKSDTPGRQSISQIYQSLSDVSKGKSKSRCVVQKLQKTKPYVSCLVQPNSWDQEEIEP